MRQQVILTKLEKYYLTTDSKNLLETAKDFLAQTLVNYGRSYFESIKTFECLELPESKIAFNFTLEKRGDQFSVILSSAGDLISIKKGLSNDGTKLYSGSGFNLSCGYSSCYSDIHKAKQYLASYFDSDCVSYDSLGSQLNKIIYQESDDCSKSAISFIFEHFVHGSDEYTIFSDGTPYAIRADRRVSYIEAVLNSKQNLEIIGNLV